MVAACILRAATSRVGLQIANLRASVALKPLVTGASDPGTCAVMGKCIDPTGIVVCTKTGACNLNNASVAFIANKLETAIAAILTPGVMTNSATVITKAAITSPVNKSFALRAQTRFCDTSYVMRDALAMQVERWFRGVVNTSDEGNNSRISSIAVTCASKTPMLLSLILHVLKLKMVVHLIASK